MNKEQLIQKVNALESVCSHAARTIWEQPELSGREEMAADYYRKLLQEEGFTLTNEEKMPHAFYAEYGKGSPVVAVLGEYDALPGLSQKVSTEQEPVEEGAPGHACGHNLLGAAAATAAIAIKRYLEATGVTGTVRFYGCPEEETLGGKGEMASYGMFEGADIALSCHPMSVNMTMDRSYLANAAARFHFKGVTSHAGYAPERGRSALDGVELMHVGVNYLREHVIDHTRMHYATDTGGYPPNIVPGHAVSTQVVRAPRMKDVRETMARIKKISEGAALMTETEVRMQSGSGSYEMKQNTRFSDLTHENLIAAQPPEYDAEEEAFAKELQATLPEEIKMDDQALYNTNESLFTGVAPRGLWEVAPINASSDSGDVSYLMPMNLFTAACWPVGVAPHTWQATASTGSSVGQKGALYAARVMAACAYDLYTQPETVREIKEEFDRRTDTPYEPVLSE